MVKQLDKKFQTRAESSPSGGQRIDDQSFWAGKPSKDSVFPMGAKTKDESSAVGAGNMARYEDTTEQIKAQQVAGVGKIKARPMKEHYRN